MASAKPVTVTLGALTERAAARVRSGRYSSMSEVLRDGLRALDRQDEMIDELLRERVRQVIADPQPAIGIDEAFKQIWARIDARCAKDNV
ncbi:type II toxin-antitoxin system ParD family antitoxin [Sphingosinicellaceae bacterium]|nr:type II toxin-antitoxin system ParD family antitoxin [Sphingosinicellaceae bacterium]